MIHTGGLSGKPDSWDYDSGARDLSPEPTSLHQLMESHDPSTLKIVQEDTKSTAKLIESIKFTIMTGHTVYSIYL
jgi:hypothetical protein